MLATRQTLLAGRAGHRGGWDHTNDGNTDATENIGSTRSCEPCNFTYHSSQLAGRAWSPRRLGRLANITTTESPIKYRRCRNTHAPGAHASRAVSRTTSYPQQKLLQASTQARNNWTRSEITQSLQMSNHADGAIAFQQASLSNTRAQPHETTLRCTTEYCQGNHRSQTCNRRTRRGKVTSPCPCQHIRWNTKQE